MEHTENYNINKTPEFYTAWSEYLNSPLNQAYRNFFNKKIHRLGTDQISPRVINHWENNGLISIQRENKEQWRKYSIMDIVWLSIIYELRNFDIGFEQIKKIKRSLISSHNECEYGELEFYSAYAFNKNVPVEVLVFNNTFQSEVATLFEIDQTKEERGLLSHISISLNGVLQGIFQNKDLKPVYDTNYTNLSDNEFTALTKLRTGKFESLVLHYDKGDIQKIEGDAIERGDVNIAEMLRASKFQDIVIKQEDGKIQYVKRTEKHKL